MIGKAMATTKMHNRMIAIITRRGRRKYDHLETVRWLFHTQQRKNTLHVRIR